MTYEVYIKTNEEGYVIAVNSSAFLSNTTDWIMITSGAGDKYHHAQGNYFPMPIITDGGAYRYKLVDGDIVECTDNDILEQESDSADYVPTALDVLEAQVFYTAMMTETLLEV